MSQLTVEQRYTISVMYNQGEKQNKIADYIGCHKSTISRELKRNIGKRGKNAGIYDAQNAQNKTMMRHKQKSKYVKFVPEMKSFIRLQMEKDKWSPELITAKGLEKYGQFVSHETIYKWLWKMKKSNKKSDKEYKSLHKYLKHDKRRQKRGNAHQNRGCIPNRCSIEQRPDIVEKRKRFGDVEVDLVMGRNHKPGLLVITDRATLKTKLRKINTKKSDYMAKAIIKELREWSPGIKTLTYDNDLAFANHTIVNEEFGTTSYFTRPYSAQDKGTIENRIGVLRMFFPKKTDFSTISRYEIKKIEKKLNSRPVRKFSYLSPDEYFLLKSKVAFIT